MSDKKPWQNADGYTDNTAYKAQKAVDEERRRKMKRINNLMSVLRYIIDKAGFEPINRIALRDKKTGEEFR